MSENLTAQAAQATPTPSDPVALFMANMEKRLAQVEQVIGIASPFLNVAEAGVEAVAPATAPLINHVSEAQGILANLLGALAGAFGPKLVLPAPPAAPLTPVT